MKYIKDKIMIKSIIDTIFFLFQLIRHLTNYLTMRGTSILPTAMLIHMG